MAMTTAQRIEALETALASGLLEVRYDGQSVKYQSIDDLKKALAYFQSKAAEESGRRSVTASFGAFYRN